MEEKINIAEILKDKPQGTKLYSSACGKCRLGEVDDKSFKISFYNSKFGFMNGGEGYLDKNGKLYDDGECVVFPSKEMRDWSKFAWKKGDVLVCKDDNSHIIFEKFNDDTYTTFTGKLYYQATRAGYSYTHTRNLAMTQDFDIEKGDAAQTYISTIEERLGGKLNRETLEIEKYQPEFKDGDVVVVDEIPFDLYSKCIFILKENLNTGEIKARAYVLYNVNKDSIFFDTPQIMKVIERNIHLATEEEKQQLFDALAKEGKAWDAEKKQIVDLKLKVELKPFDRVLCRDGVGKEWHIDLFESVLTDNSEYNYKCMVNVWKICIPYKGNEYLLGTTNNVEG
nr:MAG TPA: hypothetical protein [Caudoviricetes sp.]